MIILFVLGYSRISVVHHTLTGAETRSNVERCAYHRRVLTELGQNIYILKLQGFLFFGSATPLLEQIRRRANQTDGPQVRHIILDFRRVTGLDSSAVICFTKSLQLAEAEDFILILTNLSGGIKAQLARGGLGESVERLRLFPDLDHGLEWCEDQLLSDDKITLALAPESLRSQLRENGFEEANITRLTAFLERIELEENQFLIRQGDQADDLYFIESGSVSVYLEAEDGKRLRLQRLGPGTIVGELGLYLDITRTASVVVDSPTVAYRLTLDALEQMTGEAPKLAASFHELIARMLAERLIETNRFLEAVLR
jgi:SulP family sulfate permease